MVEGGPHIMDRIPYRATHVRPSAAAPERVSPEEVFALLHSARVDLFTNGVRMTLGKLKEKRAKFLDVLCGPIEFNVCAD